MAQQLSALLACGCFILFALQNGVALAAQQPGIYVTSDPSRGWDNSSCWYGGEQTPCSTLALAFKGVIQASNLSWHPWVYLENGSHVLNEAILFSGKDPYVQNIGIIGLTSGEQDVVINCTNSTLEDRGGVSFISINNITVRDVWFYGCGTLQNSTSTVNVYWQHGIVKFVPVYSALYFLLCKDLLFENVWVTDSVGNGMTVYATVGNNIFTNCSFSYNQLLSSNSSHNAGGGGGFYLEFPYCVPTPDSDNCSTNYSNVPSEYASGTNYWLDNCTIVGNDASLPNYTNTTFILPGGVNHMGLGRGGGMTVYFKGNINRSTITINGCYFVNNSAFWGGGLFVEFQDYSQHNNLKVLQSVFEGNHVRHNIRHNEGTGGGGARLDYIFENGDANCTFNSMIISHCHFHNNTAYFGGGVSIEIAREHSVHNATNSLKFIHCNWTQNKARLGAAIDISMWHPVTSGTAVKTTFVDTIIADHKKDSNLEVLGSLVGLGAMYVDSLPVLFQGFINFTNNHHTALAATNAEINFDSNCTVNFSNNYGRYGGALFLVSSAFIRAFPESSFRFTNNVAALLGGAIYSSTLGERNLISSRSCFIRYHNINAEPQAWKVKFVFENNTDKEGENPNSIFTSSLVPCIWGGTYGPYDPEQTEHTFCWSESNWNYTKGICNEQIATAPVTFTKEKYALELFPGERKGLGIKMRDDLGHYNTTILVLTASLTNETNAKLDPSSLYVSDNALQMYGVSGSTVNVSLHTLSPQVVYTEVTVTLLPCPPGYIGSDSNYPDNKCTCGPNGYSYGGRVRCYTENGEFRSYLISEGLWIGKYHQNDELLLVGESPYTFHSPITYGSNNSVWFPLNENNVLLGKSLHTANSNESLCGPYHRNGVLCAGCVTGYGHAINNRFMKCVDCTKSRRQYGIVYNVFLQLLPLTVVFIILLGFNIRLTSGPANAFIFFSQTITASFALYYTNVSRYFSIVKPWYVVYSVWNLRFDEVLPDYCLSQHLDTATLISLEYISAVFPLILIGVFYTIAVLYDRGVSPVVCLCRPIHHCIARIRVKTLQRSITDGLAAFLLLSYTKFTIVSLRLLSPSYLYEYWGNVSKTVMYYDGTVQYGSPQHVPFIILASISLTVFVILPPILLFLYPMKCIQKCLSSVSCVRCRPGGRVQLFLNAFYGCYKDGTEGTHDWRYFAALYFVFRIVFAVVHFMVTDFGTLYLIQQLLCTAGILLFAVFRPYTKELYNNLDAAMFGLLATINALSSYDYNRYQSWDEKSPLLPVETILIWLPMVYILSYLLYYFCETYKMKDKCALFFHWRPERGPTEDDGISDNSLLRLMDERSSPPLYNSGTLHLRRSGVVNSDGSVFTEVHVFPPSSSDEADDSGHSSMPVPQYGSTEPYHTKAKAGNICQEATTV